MIDERWLDELITLTESWIDQQRQDYYQLGSRLGADNNGTLYTYFEKALLEEVRLYVGPLIQGPAWFPEKVKELNAEGYEVEFDFDALEGITFVDVVVLSDKIAPKDYRGRQSVIFHELVHAVQYKLLRLETFTRHYILGLHASGFRYSQIPLERMAYALQRDFEQGSQFRVLDRIRSELREKGYLS